MVRRVVNLFQNYSPLLNLRVAGRVIRTTAEHPFWVVGRGWVAAHQIEFGDLSGRPGEPLPHWHPYNPNNQSFGPKQPMP